MARIILLFLLAVFVPLTSYAGSLMESMEVSASGMRVQGERMKLVAENIANAESTGSSPGQEPYRRKVLKVKNQLDRKTGNTLVKVDKIVPDKKTEFRKEYDPGNPASDEEGYVLKPNVRMAIEMMDMKEAERSYEANLNAISVTKGMVARTIELLR